MNYRLCILLIGLTMSLMTHALDTVTLAINKQLFQLELPKTAKEYSEGLMYRKHLPVGHGMLFLFDPRSQNKPAMWMKNTYIPLDLLFIDEAYRIACIIEHAQPLSLTLLSCEVPVTAIIELNAGEVKKFQLKKGDTIVGSHLKRN